MKSERNHTILRKSLLFAMVAIAITGLGVSTGVMASSPNQQHSVQPTILDSHLIGAIKEITKGKVPHPAPGSTLLVNVVVKIINDEDSGYQGYWAIDNYTLNLKIWKEPNGTFFFSFLYRGTATTYAGIPAPGTTGVEKDKGVAHFSGYIAGLFRGTFSPTITDFGFLGMDNYGGSQLLLGPYSIATPPPHSIDWLAQYSPNYLIVSETFSLSYFYQGQVWVDANNVPAADSGNIIVS